MARNGITENYLNNLVQRETRPFDLVYADIGEVGTSNPLRITNAARFIEISGESDSDLNGTFIPQSSLLGISPIDEDANFQIGEVTVTLSGVTSAAIALMLGNPYLDRSVKIWRGLLDASGSVIDAPVLMFDGRISAATIEDDPAEGKSLVNVTVSSQWVDFDRRNGNKTNDAEQQFRFPGDLGLEFAAKSIKNIEWGRERRD